VFTRLSRVDEELVVGVVPQFEATVDGQGQAYEQLWLLDAQQCKSFGGDGIDNGRLG
jgi:hypothetical protein